MTLRVQGVCDLLTADGDPLPSSLSCTVDIYRCTPKKSGEVTREHVACVSSLYESLCAADFLPKEIPLTTKSGCDFLHIVVSSGNERCNTEVGACDISLKYLNMGGTSEYLLVGGWTTPYAYGCGRVQLQFTTARSAAVRRPQQELHNFLNVRRKWRERVQSLLWATDKSQLHQCDLALDKVAEFGWNRFLQRQERVRSPPPSFRMEFKFLRWRFTSSGAPQPLRSCDDSAQLTHSNTTSKEGSFFVVLTCGVHHFVSPLFHGQQSSDAISLEGIRCRAMTVIPSSDFCRFSIFKSTPQSCVEVATAEVPLSCLVSPERQIIQVPLVTLAKRIGAALHGVLEVEVRTKGTATTQGTAWGGWEETNTRRQTLLKHLHYNASWKLHRALCILANDWRTYPSHVDYNIVCRETYGPLREQVMSKLSIVKVVSQSEVLASASVQLKVYYQDNCVMRSGVVFQEDGSATVKNNHVETLVVDPDHTSLTIVLSETHLLSSSKTLARATVSASAIQSVHQPTEMWVHFYNVKTHSPLCEMSFTLTTPQTSAVRSPDYRSSLAVEDSAYRDVLSLLAVHAPKEAGKAHSLFSSFVNRAAAHSCLRSLLLPEPVACTIYIHVEGLTSSFANVFALDDRRIPSCDVSL
ncbi:hypothetical protein AGDE_17180 [Angomonas deanei]|uniref:Uncharacterized protein n=1 Tax=Angomonas deanei TaxID=59799 RepID=A0A7G2BZX1_9TRYP|nr:hypothetical protein AGDE_17180 [Angomonas deanei]CAD2213078.1 hypothetical protein, conserved [Angomonas deanei]|eukprot:EPY15093.1 hypothetical protein AGDE_17180 [Angomonas deanei]